jgi:hypothetical protein
LEKTKGSIFKEHVRIKEQLSLITFKSSRISASSLGSLIKLAEVRIAARPFHSMKNPVHAKNLFSPAHHA